MDEMKKKCTINEKMKIKNVSKIKKFTKNFYIINYL